MYNEIPIQSNMAKTTISDLSMTPAKNGFIISYCEKVEKSNGSKGTYDNCNYSYPKEVFDIDEDDSAEDIEKAFTRFRELAMMQYNELKAKD